MSAIVPLVSLDVHRKKVRLRDLEALRRRVDVEIGQLRDEIDAAGRAAARPKMKRTFRFPRGSRKPCGTEEGYQWHRHWDRGNWPLPADDPCGCRRAHREHARQVAAS